MFQDTINLDDIIYNLTHSCSSFRPTIIVALLKHFNLFNKNINMLDISAGWGDRLIGAIASNVNFYFATDPNKNLQKGYNNIIKFFNADKTKFRIKSDPFEKVIIEKPPNNKMYDIISRKEINIWESNNIHKLWKRVESKNVKNSLETKRYLQKIKKSRKEQKTYKNDNSSRSHLFIQIKSKDKTIYFVDLAGKEHSKDSKKYNKNIKIESNYINQSLFGLKECIRASYLKNKYIPFRQCCLTRLLKDVFLGTQTIVISTLSLSNKDIYSSIDTLNYVNQLKNIKLPEISPLIHAKRSKIDEIPKLELTGNFTSSDTLIKKYITYAKNKCLCLQDNIKNIVKTKNVDEKILEWINFENKKTKLFLNDILIN